ncbi:hypothetical protein Cthiooxydans_46980 [Comamonas thiooxydans]|uniref:DUF4365 domain-containing protein n=1 Tax=Comamonas thiooxydans TaxID=363952 RepID=UPI001E3C9310|nr:DUF4365 domain-containing protein [Comamonas thiooxydans]BDB72286.1 hypothetical protein Cthiooxydans_46980 [Comamonas thiooxydans]
MSTHQTERMGVNYASTIFTNYGWLFREQTTLDFGIDAHVEIFDAGDPYPTGKLLALQIKSGKSFFDEPLPEDGGFVFRAEPKHVHYWLSHTMPVLVLFFNPETEEMYWQQVTKENLIRTGKGWKLTVPKSQRLEKGVIPREFAEMVQPEPYIQRLNRLRLDLPWMLLLAEGKQVVMEFDDWVNKSLPRYQVTMSCGNEVQKWPLTYAAGRTIDDLLGHYIPWADYESDMEAYEESLEGTWQAECYVGRDPETGTVHYGETFAEWYGKRHLPGGLIGVEQFGEVVSYRLILELNDFGRAFLELNDFLQTPGRMEKGTFTEQDLLREAKVTSRVPSAGTFK